MSSAIDKQLSSSTPVDSALQPVPDFELMNIHIHADAIFGQNIIDHCIPSLEKTCFLNKKPTMPSKMNLHEMILFEESKYHRLWTRNAFIKHCHQWQASCCSTANLRRHWLYDLDSMVA